MSACSTFCAPKWNAAASRKLACSITPEIGRDDRGHAIGIGDLVFVDLFIGTVEKIEQEDDDLPPRFVVRMSQYSEVRAYVVRFHRHGFVERSAT